MENYILRLYRRQNDHEDQIVGLLEGVDSRTLAPFKNFDELRTLLQANSGPRAEKEK